MTPILLFLYIVAVGGGLFVMCLFGFVVMFLWHAYQGAMVTEDKPTGQKLPKHAMGEYR